MYTCANNVQMSNAYITSLCHRKPMIQREGKLSTNVPPFLNKILRIRFRVYAYTYTSEDIYTVHGPCTSRGGHWRILEPSVSIPTDLRHLLLCWGSSSGPRSIVPAGPSRLQLSSSPCMFRYIRSRVPASPARLLPLRLALLNQCTSNPYVVASTAGRRSITIDISYISS
jgi:hypothetical protein